jgi:hypothetical protein
MSEQQAQLVQRLRLIEHPYIVVTVLRTATAAGLRHD